MKVLVTGIAGFVGGHLVDYLRAEQPQVRIVGLDSHPGRRVRELDVEVVAADVQDAQAVREALGRVRPDGIVHLAAQSSPQRSWDDPEATLRTNVFGLLGLMEGARAHGLAPRVLVVGSAEEYGQVDAAAVAQALGALRPDGIIHLAAQSSPQRSWEDPAGTLRTNVLGLLSL
ncbi:MAG TPA: GDP-mannose 4,6-dehydratase, partial [Vicinamibacteria bacterium]|nr:GDP-mannose 4,6-dehydratase [Vicinamibacteria bacterium]